MTLQEITNTKTLKEYVAKFVNDPRFLLVKDAFVAHTPETGVEPFGKSLGTRYVFNELERIATSTPVEPKTKGTGTTQDPDLAES